MWARVSELSLALWLGASAYLLHPAPGATGVQLNSMLTAAIVGLCALMSFHPRLEKVHLLKMLPLHFNLRKRPWRYQKCCFSIGFGSVDRPK